MQELKKVFILWSWSEVSTWIVVLLFVPVSNLLAVWNSHVHEKKYSCYFYPNWPHNHFRWSCPRKENSLERKFLRRRSRCHSVLFRCICVVLRMNFSCELASGIPSHSAERGFYWNQIYQHQIMLQTLWYVACVGLFVCLFVYRGLC